MRTLSRSSRNRFGTHDLIRLLRVAVVIALLSGCNAPQGDRALGQQSQELSGGGGGAAAGGTCCRRDVMALPIPQPTGQSDPIYLSLDYAFLYPSDTCPDYDVISAEGREGWLALNASLDEALDVPYDAEAHEIYANKLDLHYWIRGTLTVDRVTGTIERWYSDVTEQWYGPNVEGDFTLQMEIFDPHHGEVVKDGQISWSGTINSQEGIDAVEALGKSFGSLSVIFHDYERKPIRALIEPEFDPVLAGEEITIRLTDIRGDSGQPQPWWRIFVKAHQGEIANGEPEEEGYHWFRVGDGPSVEVRYRAPESCYGDELTEEIAVKNTCSMAEHFIGTPQDDIAKSEFQVLCTSYALEYDNHYTYSYGPASYELTITGRIPFRVVRNAAGAEDAFRLEGSGQLQHSLVGTFPPGCTMTTTSSQQVAISGTPKMDGESLTSLAITVDHAGAVSTGGTVVCPGGISVPVPASRNPDEEISPTTIEMDPEDGFTLEGTPVAPLVEGTWRFVLHKPGP